jgi:hypothetical protein
MTICLSKIILVIALIFLIGVSSAGNIGFSALPSVQSPFKEAVGDGSFQTVGTDVSQPSGNPINDFIGNMIGEKQQVSEDTAILPEVATINNTIATVGDGYQSYNVGSYSINVTPVIGGSQFVALSKDKALNRVSMVSDNAQFDYKVTDGQFKENITLTSPQSISFNYQLSDGWLEKNANGTIWMNTTNGPVIQIERPYAIDNSGKRVDLDYNINGDKLDLIGDISKLQ